MRQVKEAAILGHDGNVWAASTDFPVTPEELKVIAANYSKVDTLAQSGLTVAGVRSDHKLPFFIKQCLKYKICQNTRASKNL